MVHVKEKSRDLVRDVWKRLRLHEGAKPITGALVVGGAAMAVAINVGAAELVIGVLSGYAAYRMLRYGIDLRQALTETLEIERAVGP